MTQVVPGKSHGGKAIPVKPKKPNKNKNKGMFPSAEVTSGDMARLMRNSTASVNRTYDASPMPALQTYQQPFIDAANRESKLGNDMLAAIGASAQYSQGLTSGLSSWIQQNVGTAQQSAQSTIGSGAPAVPAYTTAAATALPTQSMGTSQTQYLNALAPYVAGSAQQYQRDITTAGTKALGEYNTAVQERSGERTKTINDLYETNLKVLQTSRQNVTKNAIAEYIALVTGGMKAKDAAEKVRVDTAKILHDLRANEIAQQRADAGTTNAATNAYKAAHPSTGSGGTGNETQARKDALKSYRTKLGTDSDVVGYQREVKFSYVAPASGVLGAPTTKTVSISIPAATQDPNDPSFKRAVAAWIRNNNGRYPSARLTSTGTPVAQKTPGVTIHYGPGLGTNWQNAVTAYAAHFAPNPGESAAAFRKRMAAAVAIFLPRPKAK